MSSFKVLFCDICLILLFGYTIVLAEENTATTEDSVKSNCTCGGFSTLFPGPDNLPIVTQSPSMIINCEEDGELVCKNLCHAIGIAAKAKGTEVLCKTLKDANKLMIAGFYKACGNPWKYADVSADAPICCENGEVKSCVSEI